MKRTLFVCAFIVTLAAAPTGASRHPEEHEMSFKSGVVTLSGTLSLPSGTGPFPAVVLLSGSGPQNRDSEIAGFRPFRLIAEHFASRGIAVLRLDDRGVGGSTGFFAETTTHELAEDALAAIRVLRARREIDGRRIGLLGHSEGALVAAVAASQSADVAFIAWLAGSAVSGAEIMRQQAEEMPRRAGASPAAIEDILRHHDALMSAVKENASAETLTAHSRTLLEKQRAATPGSSEATQAKMEALIAQSVKLLQSKWMRYFVTFDPAATLRRVRIPVFAAFGGRDVQVPEAVNRARLEAALSDAGNPATTVRVYAEANHLFMPAVSGQVTEYARLPKAFVPALLDDIATWIAGR